MSVTEQYIHHPEWTQGYNAHIQGVPRQSNSYRGKTGEIAYQAWDQGWRAAERERNHVEVADSVYDEQLGMV